MPCLGLDLNTIDVVLYLCALSINHAPGDQALTNAKTFGSKALGPKAVGAKALGGKALGAKVLIVKAPGTQPLGAQILDAKVYGDHMPGRGNARGGGNVQEGNVRSPSVISLKSGPPITLVI